MRGEGILSENHDERARSFAPGRGKGRDAGPRCAAAVCARHAHRAVRRHVRSAARGAPRRLPAGAAPAWPRPGVVARHAGQSAEGYPAAWRRLPRASPPRRRWRTIRASTSPTSRPSWARPIPTRPCPICVRRCPGVHFVWIMGADNLRSFHRWQRWRGIAQLVPIAIVDRLGPSLYATGSAAAQALARYRLPEAAARKLADHKPPAWIYLHGLKSPLSSTALRAARALKRR